MGTGKVCEWKKRVGTEKRVGMEKRVETNKGGNKRTLNVDRSKTVGERSEPALKLGACRAPTF